MPAKNSRKQYLENGYYHIYNRGVEKRIIFLDKQDYSVFLSYLKEYLMPKDEKGLLEKLADSKTPYKEKDKILKLLRLNNFYGQIFLLAYCLMPNHFHFFVKQKDAGSIDKFMNSLGTRYTMYFNKKYTRVGSLYQGVYKAVNVINETQFVYLSKYIHKQALALQGEALQEQSSSFKDYLGQRESGWVNTEEILSLFSKTIPNFSYQALVRNNNDKDNIIENIALEDNE